MIKNLLRFIFALSVVLITTVSAHADNPNKCVRAIATDIANSIDTIDLENDVLEITSDSLIEFFTKNIDICREYLLERESPEEDILIEEDDLLINVNWDYVVEEVAAALTVTGNARQLFICENDRSIQASIDAALWATTIVAAAFSFGTGGVAGAAIKEGVKQGAKGIVKLGVKQGLKTASKAASKAASKEAAKKAAVATAQKPAKDAAIAASKKALQNTLVSQTKNKLKSNGKKRVTNKMIKKEIEKGIAKNSTSGREAISLLDDAIAKQSALKTAGQASASQALKKALTTFAISTSIAVLSGIGAIYSYLESDLDTTVMNCTNTDGGENCYLSCTKDSLTAPTDDLNTKVFKPTFGKTLCVDENNNYALREINTQGIPTPGNIFLTTQDKWEKAKQLIVSNVQNQGNCDWNEDDVDMYIGVPLYDSSTLEPTENGSQGLLIDGIRIDD